MTKTKSTKSALMLSALAILLCVSMLVGSTFAWFTDSVASNNNIIKSGNLDAELSWSKDGVNWEEVDKDTNVFTNQLWEPGHTEVVYFKLVNAGSLAFKYNFGVNVVSETTGINVNNAPFKLSDYIQFGIIEDIETAFASREAAVAAVTDSKIISKGYSKAASMASKDEKYLAMVVYMPKSVGNEANYKTGTTAPQINLGINLFATQYTEETDSFGKDYDKDAAWVGGVDTTWYDATKNEFTLDTAEDLAGLAQLVNAGNSFKNMTINLNADIDLNNVLWTPIGKGSNRFEGTFNGNGYTISNLFVTGDKALGLFGRTFTGAHIENVKIDGAYVAGNDYVGAILGQGYLGHNCIKNCTVTKAIIIATPYLMEDGKYDGGAKAGAIAGQAYNGNITGNTVTDSTIIAYRDLGAIAGMLDFDGSKTVEASDNTVNNVTLSYYGLTKELYADGKANENMGEVVGRVGKNATVSSTNTVTNVTMDKADEGVYEIYTLADLLNFANSVNSGVTYAGKTVKLGANIDLNNMEWTPIGTGSGFYGTFDGATIDGGNHIIKNLKITGNKSTVGLFANTYNGEIKNLTVENAQVSGYFNVGVVAGYPYTSKYTNITVKGHVEVNGFAYVGGVGGKNAYANWTDITVNVDETSYVKAVSTENGNAYRTYVGGVVGFNGEGSHTFKNITTNIDVIGSTIDVGGAFGIAHYGNKFENITVTGNVTITNAAEAADAEEMGGIAGVWHNETGYEVSFIDCVFTGKLTANVDADLSDNTITGKAYSATGKGTLVIINYVTIDGVIYANDLVNGKTILYLVPADYEGTTVNVPEGVDTIGNYAFAYNSNVKEVVLSSTVRDLGRGFDSAPSVEKVVLNEGLTTISSRAFKSTTALKEVVFSSTITEIADNAFQKSGIKEIVIPASVKTIGEAAFGSSLIETVTFEGDIAIQGYAFRGCTKLSTVNMNGYNVTFIASTLNNRNSCWFCNGESNNPNTSNITFNVKTDVIKDRVLAAMGAEKNNTPVNVEMTADDAVYVIDAAGLEKAVKAGAKAVILAEGDYALRFTNNTNFNLNDMTIKGLGNVNLAISSSEAWYGRVQGSNVTFENIHFTSSVGATGKATYNNCTFDSWAICASSNKEETTFNNCTINGCLNTSTDFSSGDVFVNNCKIAKAEYSGSMTMNFVDCQIGEIIIWNANTNLTNCQVTKLDDSNVTNATVTIK